MWLVSQFAAIFKFGIRSWSDYLPVVRRWAHSSSGGWQSIHLGDRKLGPIGTWKSEWRRNSSTRYVCHIATKLSSWLPFYQYYFFSPTKFAILCTVTLPPGQIAKTVACGGYHTLVLTESNEVYGFGWNKGGCVGGMCSCDGSVEVGYVRLAHVLLPQILKNSRERSWHDRDDSHATSCDLWR